MLLDADAAEIRWGSFGEKYEDWWGEGKIVTVPWRSTLNFPVISMWSAGLGCC